MQSIALAIQPAEPVPASRMRRWWHGSLRAFRWGKASGKLLIPTGIGLVTAVAVIAGTISAVAPTSWVEKTAPFQGIGTAALVAVAGALLRVVYNAARSPRKTGRQLGVLWDLASFWPREAHPLVPPAYAPRAIRDQERFIATAEVPTDKPLILCGHSQGSLIMYALAHRLTATAPERAKTLSLLTYGSQLGWAYGRAFPSVLDHTSHARLRIRLRHRWINLVRFTDYIGDGVVSYVEGNTLRPYLLPITYSRSDDQLGARYLVSVSVGQSRTQHLAEVWLPDPSPGDFPSTMVRQHSYYTSDVTWDRWIEQFTPQ